MPYRVVRLDSQDVANAGIKSDAFIHGVGDEAAEGCMSFIEGSPLEKLPGGAAFLSSYEKHGYEQAPEAYGPFAYAAMVQLWVLSLVDCSIIAIVVQVLS